MSQWLLLVNSEETEAQAIEVRPYQSPGGAAMDFISEGGNSEGVFSIDLYHGRQRYKNPALQASAKNGGGFAYQVLWEEGALRHKAGDKHAQIGVNLQLETAPQSITGKSGDLLFALAVITAALPREGGYPSFAATGELREPFGSVHPVNGIPAKFGTAIEALSQPAGGRKYLFYPAGNDSDVPDDVRKRAMEHGIELCPLTWFDEALEKLDVPVLERYLGNPYRGLESFTYAQRRVYFGRREEARALAEDLAQLETAGTTPALAILAASGAGKSSFIHAGLRPALEKLPSFQARAGWFHTWTPRQAVDLAPHDPAVTLDADRLLQHLRGCFLPEALAARLDAAQRQALQDAASLPELARALAAAVSGEWRYVWIVDQAEELFTHGYSDDALHGFAAFLGALRAAGVWVVLALRNDFFPNYQKHLLKSIDREHKLHELSRADLYTIIREPAKRAQRPPIQFQVLAERDLVDELLADIPPGEEAANLPLLQYALGRLYESALERLASGQAADATKPRALELAYDDYQAMRRLPGAIGQTAERCQAALPEAAREALPHLLWQLTVVSAAVHADGPARYGAQSARLDDYPPGSPGRALIDAFAAPDVRLLVLDNPRDGAPGRVRVAHEALLNHWPTAKTILDGLRDDLPARARLDHDLSLWLQQGRPADGLLPSGWRLAEGQHLLAQRAAFLGAEQIDYLHASLHAENERQRREAERIEKEHALAEEARRQAELAKERAEQVARQQTELADQQTQLAQERQERAEKLRRKAKQLLATTVASLAATGVAGWFWHEAGVQKLHAEQQKLIADEQTRVVKTKNMELAETFARSDFNQGMQLVEHGEHNRALAYLARAIRTSGDRNSSIVASSLLVSRMPPISIIKHEDIVDSAVFSPDGRSVLTASSDKTARVWDAQTGAPFSLPMQHKNAVNSAVFSPDGKWVLTASLDKTARVWAFSDLHSPGEKFADFLEAISGYRLDVSSGPQFSSIQSKQELHHTWLATAQDLNPEARHLIDWLLSDPLERTVTPNGKQTVKQRVQQLIDLDTMASLNEALDYWPGHPLALAKLAAVSLRDAKPEERDSVLPRARLWANLALKFAPEDAAVQAIAAPIATQ